MEAQHSFDEHGVLSLLTAINSVELLAQNDYLSQIFNELNPSLFSQLKLIEIQNITLLQKKVHSRKQLNRLRTPTGDVPSPSHATKRLINSAFVGDTIEPITKYLLDDGQIHSVNPNKLSSGVNSIGSQTVTLDDLPAAKVLATVEEIKVPNFSQITFLAFKDFSFKYSTGDKVKYGLEVSFVSKTIDFVRELLKTLQNVCYEVLALQKASSVSGIYDYSSKTFKQSFLIELNSANGFSVKQQGQKIIFNKEENIGNKSEAIWIRAPKVYDLAMKIIGIDDQGSVKNLFGKLNPNTGSPQTFQIAYKQLSELLIRVKRTYDLEFDSLHDLSGGSTSQGVVKVGQSANKINHKIDYFFKDSINVNMTKNYGFRFIKLQNTQSFPSLSRSQWKNRIKQEKNKFFKREPSLGSVVADSLSQKNKQDLVDFSLSSGFFSPHEVVFGSQKKNLLETNKRIFENSFFNDFSLIKTTNIKTPHNKGGSSFSQERNLSAAANLFGLTVSPSEQSIVEKRLHKSSGFTDARSFLGDNTYLSLEDDRELNLLTPTFSEVDKQDSRKFVSTFSELKTTHAKVRNISLSSFSFDGEGFNVSMQNLRRLPVSVKALFLDTKNSSFLRFPLSGGLFDPLKNVQTREVIKQNYLNIRELQYLSGFQKVNGVPDLNNPIWESLTSDKDVKDVFCRLSGYENLGLGIIQSPKGPSTFDSLFILRGKK